MTVDLDGARILADLLVGSLGAGIGLWGTTRLHAWRIRALESRMGSAEAALGKLNIVNAAKLAKFH